MNCAVCLILDIHGIHRRRKYRHRCRHSIHIQANPSVCYNVSIHMCGVQHTVTTLLNSLYQHAHVHMNRIIGYVLPLQVP